MVLATIRDQVGILESKCLNGGIILLVLDLFSMGKDFHSLFNMYSNSYSEIWELRSGVHDIADNQTKTHRNPDSPKITNGPNILPFDKRIGDCVSPIAFPKLKSSHCNPNSPGSFDLREPSKRKGLYSFFNILASPPFNYKIESRSTL
jgi:hypothetical protein